MNIKRLYLIGFFVILALPLLTSSLLFNPPAWGKTIVFRIILSILIFFFIYQLVYQKTLCKKSAIAPFLHKDKNKVFWPLWLLIALWGIFLLATIFSLDPYYSFWDSPLRGGGFLNFSFYIIFAILTFLIIRKSDWQKIWLFTISIGVLISIIAIFQQFKVLSKIIIPYAGRPPSTMGGPMFLALYLLLLVFITFSFALKEKQIKKKLFYFSAILLFLYVILLTGSRATYFGLSIGFFYFLFLYSKNLIYSKRIKTLFIPLKILAGILLITIAYGIYYPNNQLELLQFVQDNKTLKQASDRLSISLILEEPRFSAWKVSFEAIKAKPILGYGPENFSIAFDKYYDPLLPYITRDWGSWYDKAHSFLFDISVTAGIPALIIYLSLFAALFWGLQKIKKKKPEQALICHAIQATFLAYLAANLFGFNVFSTYLILFLIIAYSLSLISKSQKSLIIEKADLVKKEKQKEIKPAKPMFLSILFFILIWFIWSFNLKPLQTNKEINWVDYYVKTDQCEKALEKMEADVLSSQSIIDSYVKLKYIDTIGICNRKIPGLKITLAPKAISVLKEVAKIRPYYTRTWIFLGTYTNILIGNKEYFRIENVEELKKQAYSYFEKAYELSPKREQVFISWIQTDLLFENYQAIKEKAGQCIVFDPESAYCWWIRGISNIYLDEVEQGIKDIEMANKKRYDSNSKRSLSQLSAACEQTKDIKCFGKLSDIYYTLTGTYSSDPEYHLYSIYISVIGEREEILKEQIKNVFRNLPELESELKDTLKSTNKINMEMVNPIINNSKKIVEIETILKDLLKLQSKLKICFWSVYEYENKVKAINETIAQMKLIKND